MQKKKSALFTATMVGLKVLFIAAVAFGIFFYGSVSEKKNRRSGVESLFHCTIDLNYKEIYYYWDGFTDLDYLWVFEGDSVPVDFLQTAGELFSSLESPEAAEEFSESFYLKFGKEEYRADLTQQFLWREADVYDGGAILYVPHEKRIYFYAYTM